MEAPGAVAAALDRYRLRATQEPVPVSVGALNQNYRVATASGTHFVRRHRSGLSREQIEAEHSLLAWLSSRGIPVVTPLATPEGGTTVEADGSLWSVFPWVFATSPGRGAMTPTQTHVAGEVLGRIHRVLADYPHPEAPSDARTFDTTAATSMIEGLIRSATDQRAERWIVDGLRRQLALLEEHGDHSRSWAVLPPALCHGDYHDQQLLFDGPELLAVTDWELVGLGPRLREVVRSLFYSGWTDQPLMAAFIAGYREHIALDESECRDAMDLWWQDRLHTAWVFQAYLLEGNSRVAGLISTTIRALEVLADPRAREALTDRFVQAAIN